jgi:hypothetical protein
MTLRVMPKPDVMASWWWLVTKEPEPGLPRDREFVEELADRERVSVLSPRQLHWLREINQRTRVAGETKVVGDEIK